MSRVCVPEQRCYRRDCDHCGPIRAADQYHAFWRNIEHYGGRVVVVAVTPPGKDVLPWVERELLVAETGELVRRSVVHPRHAYAWNSTASARYSRLWKAASKASDGVLKRHGWRSGFPRRVANVWAPQERGVWHIHEALPAATPAELLWSRTMVDYIDAVRKREFQIDGEIRWEWILEELGNEIDRPVIRRSFYGFGFVDRNPMRKMMREIGTVFDGDNAKAIQYLARNASEYLGQNASSKSRWISGRSNRVYISRALTMATGVTLTNLRRKRYLHVCLTKSLPLPGWPPIVLEKVWGLLVATPVVARGP